MNKEELLISEEPPVQILFYPISLSNNRINGVGIGDHIPSQSDVALIADFDLLKFFTPEIFFFQTKSDRLNFPRENRCDKCNIFAFINNEFEDYLNLNSRNQFCRYIDKYTKKLNSLKHLVTKSKRVDGRKRECISLAIDFGFPLINIVSFSQNAILRSRDNILKEWEDIIKSQRGDLERDFVRTLKRGTRIIKDEYSSLFAEFAKISGENPLPAAEPLFSFIDAFPEISSLSHISPPKIFFDQVSIKAIFDLNRECANEFSQVISSEFKNREYNAEVGYNVITKSKKRDGYRIRFLIDLTFPRYMDLSCTRWRLEELRDIILSKLREVDPEAHEIFCKGRLEIWLKKVRVNIIIHEILEVETIYLIRESFRGILDSNSILSQSISKNLKRIIFRLSFDKITDYSISDIDIFYDISDRYTRLAIEKMYRGEFSEAVEYLKRGKNGLLGDLYMIGSKETKFELSRKLSRRALDCYKRSKIDNSIISEGYFDNQFKDRVLTALEINSDWMISLRLFLKARDLQKDLKNEKTENKLWLEQLYRKYSGLNLERNLNSFTEKIGNFYSILLVNLQRKYGISPKKLLGFDF